MLGRQDGTSSGLVGAAFMTEDWRRTNILVRGIMATSGVGARRGSWRAVVAALAAGAVLLTAGCSGDKSPSWQDRTQGGASASPEPPQSTVAVTEPAAGATGVQALAEVKYTTEDPENTTVTVKNRDGDDIDGTLDKDNNLWRPTRALAWGEQYTITVNGTATGDKIGTASSVFTVMKKPSKLVRVSSFLGDGQVVGVGMPLIIRFGRSIPQKYRADVQRRMHVKATPPQEGIWHWTSPTEVHYRPKAYWAPYSKVSYSVDLAGVPMGDGWYGRSNLTVDLKIGRSFVMTVENKTKAMTVRQNGKIIKTIPVSLGKPSTPSASGTMVVIEKKRHTVFDTMEELGPDEGYRTKIEYAQRITWSGQFIHAAPWSEGVQGRRNVSHGCVNVSMAMGDWLFSRTLMGDPITVRGTEAKLENGNGWTDWNMSWDEYKNGSAI